MFQKNDGPRALKSPNPTGNRWSLKVGENPHSAQRPSSPSAARKLLYCSTFTVGNGSAGVTARNKAAGMVFSIIPQYRASTRVP